jgi:hypothetical protein
MKDEVITANTEAESKSVGNQSASDFVRRRSEKLQGVTQEESQEPAEEPSEATEEPEAVATEPEVAEESSEENVLSQFNLDEMSEEELSVLRKKLIPGAEGRIGELTARRKAAEEQLAAIQYEQSQLKLKQPEVKNNPFSDVNTLDDLQEKANEVVDVISWAEDLLFESDGYHADDEITQVEGKPMTKAEVRKALLNARKSRDSYIPDQLKKLQTIQDAHSMRQQLGSKAIEELEWLQGEEENEMKSQFINLMNDPRLKSLEHSAPDLYSQIPYFMSHAVNSIYGRKIIKDSPVGSKAKGNVTLDPSSSTTPSSAASEKTDKPITKAVREHQNRFRSEGTKDSFIKMRTLQLKNR